MLEQRLLGPGVERGGRLVEHQERRVAEERAREGDALPLPHREVVAADELLAEHRCRSPSGSAARNSSAPPGARRGRDRVLVVERVGAAEADVLARRELVAHEVLEDHADVLAPRLGGSSVGGVDAVPQHPALRRAERAGPAAWPAWSCPSRSRPTSATTSPAPQAQAHVVQGGLGAAGVAEAARPRARRSVERRHRRVAGRRALGATGEEALEVLEEERRLGEGADAAEHLPRAGSTSAGSRSGPPRRSRR